MSLVPETPAPGPLDLDRDASSVVEFLEKSKWALDVAVEMTGPSEVAQIKAQVVMADTYARELSLSRDIQEQSREMVRRAEYALGRAIRKGQEEGTVATKQQLASRAGLASAAQRLGQCQSLGDALPKPSDFATESELMGARSDGLYALADASPAQFEEALTEAKDEGNLSRANLVRKIRQSAPPAGRSPETRNARAELIEDLAAQGYSSRQMPERVGVSEETVRQIARDYGITIPADKAIGRTRRINSAQIVENTATALEGLVMGLDLINVEDVDPAVASQWADSLTDSMRALNRFVRQLKEQTQ